jgi:hypothetical protein
MTAVTCRSTCYLVNAILISGRADPTRSPAGGHRRERGSVAGCQLSNTGIEGAGCNLKGLCHEMTTFLKAYNNKLTNFENPSNNPLQRP